MKSSLDNILIVLLFNIMLSCPAMVQAVIVSGLYEAEIPVSAKSTHGSKKNIAAVFRIVLIKLTGDSHVSSRTGIPELLLHADQYVQQFEYRRKKENKTQALYFWVRFNKASLDKVLREAAIPKWGSERPSILIWLAVEDAMGRHLSGVNDGSIYADKMEIHAKNRGIVLIHPLFDLEGINQLQIGAIWDGLQKSVLAASHQYRADVVLTGKLKSVLPELWEAHWEAYIDENTLTWVTQGKLIDTVLYKGVNALVDILAERYGQAGTHTQSVETEILVHDISDYRQYSKVLNYLESLNSVTKVDVREVGKNSVLYMLTTQANIKVISKTINLGEMLEQINISSYRLVQ